MISFNNKKCCFSIKRTSRISVFRNWEVYMILTTKPNQFNLNSQWIQIDNNWLIFWDCLGQIIWLHWRIWIDLSEHSLVKATFSIRIHRVRAQFFILWYDILFVVGNDLVRFAFAYSAWHKNSSSRCRSRNRFELCGINCECVVS
jgi:hypothetical protein